MESIVSKIVDGDSFEIKNGWKWSAKNASGKEIRIANFDAPEKNQAGYQQATQRLSNLILGQNVKIEGKTLSYGRMVADVYIVNNGRWELLTNFL